jgi:regulator of RNase E activity RraA
MNVGLTGSPNGTGIPALLEQFREFDTCTIANAIERLGVRLRNEGYTRPGLQCVTGGYPCVLGYAATCQVRSSDPPMSGRSHFEHTDWWSAIERLQPPRIVVIQDLESDTSQGSLVGEVHAAILKAFQCVAVVTDGAVRDIPGVRNLNFPMFARKVAVSHSYAHVVEHGQPVRIFGLQIRSGDLLMVDCHGAISIPHEIAPEIPKVAAQIRAHERRIIDLCESPDFSVERLLQAIRGND